MSHGLFDEDRDLIFVRSLCPDFTEEELAEADRDLCEYFDIAIRIHERLEQERKMMKNNSSLTDLKSEGNINKYQGD